MEKKTIGGFIAALRKANGMTQRELAEKLHVSDKTVSRWERDDGAPDLSAIPVIAEIFGVTCDELLRGERKPPAERADVFSENEPTPKGEKQRQRLLAVSLSGYRTRTLISMGVSVIGLIAAAIGNLGFLRSYLGFLMGMVFYVISVVCQMVFLNGAFFSVSDEAADDGGVNRFKREVIFLARDSVCLTAVIFGFTTPLLLGDTYSGLVESWPFFGALGAVLALALYGVVWYFLNASLLKKGVYFLNEKEERIYSHNHSLQRRCTLTLLSVIAATLLFHVFGSEMLWNAGTLVRGVVFYDYESFVEYMEQPVEYDGSYPGNDMAAAPVPGSTIYYDRDGNEISEEDAIRGTLVDKNGTVVCEYLHRNRAASTIRPTVGEGSALPVTVITNDAWRQAWRVSQQISILYCVFYVLEIVATLVYYFRRRLK